MSGFPWLADAVALSRACDGMRHVAMAATALWLTGCGETLFQSNFDANALNRLLKKSVAPALST